MTFAKAAWSASGQRLIGMISVGSLLATTSTFLADRWRRFHYSLRLGNTMTIDDVIVPVRRAPDLEAGVERHCGLNALVSEKTPYGFIVAGVRLEIDVRAEVPEQMRVHVHAEILAERIGDLPAHGIVGFRPG